MFYYLIKIKNCLFFYIDWFRYETTNYTKRLKKIPRLDCVKNNCHCISSYAQPDDDARVKYHMRLTMFRIARAPDDLNR